jgi:hypothetical protein
MAEISTAPAPVTTVTAKPAVEIVPLSSIPLKVRELNALGQAVEYSIALPQTTSYADLTVDQKIWLLKSGSMNKSTIPMIYSVILYAEGLMRKTGADIDVLQGDVYATGEGRIALSNKAKIKIANATGRIVGVEWEIHETGEPIELEGCTLSSDLECVVKLYVKGWEKPIINIQRLSEWYMKSNPNWRIRPEHMLRLNTYAHACEFVFPTTTEDDEAPPSTVTITGPSADEIIASVSQPGTFVSERVDSIGE